MLTSFSQISLEVVIFFCMYILYVVACIAKGLNIYIYIYILNCYYYVCLISFFFYTCNNNKMLLSDVRLFVFVGLLSRL